MWNILYTMFCNSTNAPSLEVNQVYTWLQREQGHNCLAFISKPSQSPLITDLHQNIQESGLISQNQLGLNCISLLNTVEFTFHIMAKNFKYQQNATQTVRPNQHQRSIFVCYFIFIKNTTINFSSLIILISKYSELGSVGVVVPIV